MPLSIVFLVRPILIRQHLAHTQLPIVSAMQVLMVQAEGHVHSVQWANTNRVLEVHVPTVMLVKHPSVHSQTA